MGVVSCAWNVKMLTLIRPVYVLLAVTINSHKYINGCALQAHMQMSPCLATLVYHIQTNMSVVSTTLIETYVLSLSKQSYHVINVLVFARL